MNKILSRGNNGRATADFFTGNYRLSASVQTYNRRLLDILSDRMTDYLELLDIYVSRINKPGDIVATYQKGSLVKREINFILLPSDTEIVPKERSFGTKYADLSIFTTIPSFEVQGKFQWVGDIDPKAILSSDTQKFLTILNGTAANSVFPNIAFQGPAILINKSKVEVFCIDNSS